MQKIKRLLAIESIISGEAIQTQEALLKKLKGKGIICTQATLSRNLRQLGVGRIPNGKGGYMYALSSRNEANPESGGSLNLVAVIREVIEAKGLMVIKTIPGNANATAYYIDNAGRYEIAGTVAGDDTLLVIPRDGITMNQVHSCLELIMPGMHEHIERAGTKMLKKGKIQVKNKL
jgi:transcriptional regulator of arginine metabolism